MAEFTDEYLAKLVTVDTKIDNLAVSIADIKSLLAQREEDCKECKREIFHRIGVIEEFHNKLIGISIGGSAVVGYVASLFGKGAP